MEGNVEVLCEALKDVRGTALFRHEIAYVLGQMQAASATPTLLSILADVNDDVVVRHEVRKLQILKFTGISPLLALTKDNPIFFSYFFFLTSLKCAEALGAIGDALTLPSLDAGCGDKSAEVAETCAIAARRVRWVLERRSEGDDVAGGKEAENPYESVDPAPSKEKLTPEEIPTFGAQLLDSNLPLFERYKAMFSLRNAGSKAAVLALCAGFQDASPLFRHEIAYVLGQLQHPASVPSLKLRTQDEGEHEMVRHEAAEALGAIGTSECVEFLKAYTGDLCPTMLRESCVVALDAVDYWAGGEQAI